MKRNYKLTIKITIIFSLLLTCFLDFPNLKAKTYQISSYHDVEVDASRFVVERSENDLDKAVSLPSAYSLVALGYDTPIKNQNPYGTCWTFATMASAESNVLISEQSENVDLSELHLAYFLYNRNDDPLHLTTGDTNTLYDSTNDVVLPLNKQLNNGGNLYLASIGIAGGLGFVDETLVPYGKATSVSLGNIPNYSLAYEANSYLLTDAYWLSMSDEDTIKEVLMNEGAIGFSIYYDSSYFNSDNNAHYCYNILAGTNHAVTIVGWDDNYSRKNFGSSVFTRPLSNGAWLVKNSWGSSWGDEGYFWVSYSDMSIASIAVKFCAEKIEENYDIYQYDGTCAASSLEAAGSSITYGNIYTAQNESYLDKVGYFSDSADTNYKIDIYTDIQDETKPTSGTLALSMSGNDIYAGYHTIELSKYVKVNEGSKFSIVITQTIASGKIAIFVDADDDYSWIKFTNKSAQNQSFFSLNGEELENKTYENEAKETAYYTARVKAYAIDIPEFEYEKLDKTKLVKYNGSQSEIIIPNKTKAIGEDLFNGDTNITSITINEGAEIIGENFCKDCTNLKEVTLPSTITEIKAGAFENVALTTLNIPEDLVVVDVEATTPQCETDGNSMGYHCLYSENLKIESQTINKLNHDFNNYITNNDATFSNDGTLTSDCSRCEKQDTKVDSGSKKIATSLEIKTKGYISYYHINDKFDLNTTILTASDGNGYSEDKEIDESFYTGFDSKTAGEKTITFTYLDVEVTDTITIVEYKLGDFDEDGYVTSSDAIVILMNIFYPNEYPLNQQADFNRDGIFTDADAIYLLMNSFFPNEYPIYDWWINE